MSAICGIQYVDGSPVERALLAKMCSIVDYRGPDGEGTWVNGEVGLGYRLLINTPESVGEKQPWSNGRNLWITADCRIDNRVELEEKFRSCGGRDDFRNLPDASYILLAYERWGEEAPLYLLGDFAFAIWDSNQQQLFCARDPLGVKPFVYYWNGRKFLFASDAKQILQDPAVSRAPNLRYLADLLTMRFPDREESSYEEVQKLAPGYSLVVKKDGFRLKKYWDWEPDEEPLSKASLEDCAEKFQHLFQEAVRARLRTPPGYRTGSLLSGGLDSSSIVAVAASHDPRSFPVFSLHFPEANQAYQYKNKDAVDERGYAGALIEKYGLERYTVEIKGLGPFQNLDENLWYQESPLAFPNLAFFQHLFRQARFLQIRPLLNGEGGDELFTIGSLWITDCLKEKGVQGLLRELKGRREKRGTSYAELLSLTLRSVIPENFRSAYRRFLKKGVPPWIDKGFSKKMRLEERFQNSFFGNPKPAKSASYGLFAWLKGGNTPLYLETWNRAAVRWQIEMRFPFLDLRLFRFMASIPWDYKTREGITKVLLRRAMKDRLPHKILNRHRKSEFTPVVRAAFEKYLLNAMRETFETPHPLLRTMIIPKKVEKLYREYFSSRGGRMKLALSPLFLWYLTAIDQWLKQAPDYSGKGGWDEKESKKAGIFAA